MPQASAVGRLTSFSIDFILLLPLLNLVSTPFYKMAQSSLLLDQKGRTVVELGAGLLIMAATYVVVTALQVQKLRGTFGQRLVGLEVASETPGASPSLWSLVLRQGWVLLSIALLGLPLLGLFFPPRYRTWGDRISETHVLSSKAIFQARPHAFLMNWARSVAAFFLLMTLVAAAAFFVRSSPQMPAEAWALGCEQLHGEPQEEKRLEKALGLFAAGLVDAKCLEQESHRATHQGGSLPLIYLAQSFAQANSSLSDAYLEKVCEEARGQQGSLSEEKACEFSVLVRGWQDWLFAQPPSASAQVLLGLEADYALVWGVRQFASNAWFEAALDLLEPLSQRPYLSEFVQSQRVHTFWKLGQKNLVKELFEKTGALWASDLVATVSEQLCSYDLEREGCAGSEGLGCHQFIKSSQEQPSRLNKGQSALVLQSLSCPQQRSLALSESWSSKLHEELTPLWKAVVHLQKGDPQRAQLVMSSVAEGEQPLRAPSSAAPSAAAPEKEQP